MADPAFRNAQWEHRYDPHIAPINLLVDTLCSSGRGWAPYVAPMYGGIHAKLLSLLRDPGPKTRSETGSGFLSMENDDPTAEAINNHFKAAGIAAEEAVPWNIFPWYMNRSPNAAQIAAGLPPLHDLIKLLPKLRVVMVHGGSARIGWQRFASTYKEVLQARGIHVIETYHTSRQAFWHRDPKVRESRKNHLRNAFAQAAQLLASG